MHMCVCVYIHIHVYKGDLKKLSFKSKGTMAQGRKDLCEEGI